MTKKQKERLERLLVVVPYILRHQDVAAYHGADIKEIERRFGLKRRRLALDLKFLSSYISPAGDSRPDECVDAYIEDGQAFIFGPLNFKAPMALRSREWAALASAGELLGGTGALGRGLRALAQRLRRLPRSGADGALKGQASLRPRPAAFGRALETLRKAAGAGKKISFRYFSRARGEAASRKVSPHKLLMLDGEWYLAATEAGKQVKTFRVDRMDGAKMLAEAVGEDESAAYSRWSARGTPFEFRDDLAVRMRKDGKTVELRGKGDARLLELYFRFYSGWGVDGSRWFRELVRGKLARMIEMYQ